MDKLQLALKEVRSGSLLIHVHLANVAAISERMVCIKKNNVYLLINFNDSLVQVHSLGDSSLCQF